MEQPKSVVPREATDPVQGPDSKGTLLYHHLAQQDSFDIRRPSGFRLVENGLDIPATIGCKLAKVVDAGKFDLADTDVDGPEGRVCA